MKKTVKSVLGLLDLAIKGICGGFGEKIEVNNLIRMEGHFSLYKQPVQIIFSSTLPQTSAGNSI